MSIQTLRERGLPGITMQYAEGGKFQVYRLGDKEIRFAATASLEEIVTAFKGENNGR